MRVAKAALLVIALAATACGTRQTHDAVVAAADNTTGVLDNHAPTAASALATDDATASVDTSPDAVAAISAATGHTAGAVGPAGKPAGSTAAAGGQAVTGSSSTETKSPITIASLGTLSGVVGNAVLPIVTAARVWVRQINEHGGLNGHRVSIVAADDGADPARNRALAQELVETRKVIAFVGNPGVVTGMASFEYLKSKRVPVVGSDTGGDYFYDAATFFPQASHGFALLQGLVGAALEGRTKKVTIGIVSCVEAQICEDGVSYYPKVVRSYGQDVSYIGRVSLAQPDFTAECLNAAQRGVELVLIGLDGATIQRFAASCARQNYHPTLVWGASATNYGMLNDRNLNGDITQITMAPWMLDTTPGLREFQHAMATYNGGLGAAQITGWTAAKLLELGGRELPEPPTREALLNGLWSIKNNDLDGITQPLTFERNKPAKRVACWWPVLIRNGAFVSPDGGRRHCAPIVPK